MSRQEKIKEYMNECDEVYFNMNNLIPILENLEKADKDNRLREFVMNVEPYRSAFPFYAFNDPQRKARSKDHIAIVFALNLYGCKIQGFATRINCVLKSLLMESVKNTQIVLDLIYQQVQLQTMNISLINYIDSELLTMVNGILKKDKKSKITRGLLCIIGSSIGLPGFTMSGLLPLTLGCVVLLFYGFAIFIGGLGVVTFKDKEIEESSRQIGECFD